MSNVLLQTRPLGNKRLYEALFGEVFVSGRSILREDVRSYCLASLYLVGPHIDGALELLQGMGALHLEGAALRADDGVLSELEEHDVGYVVARRLLLYLSSTGEIDSVFPSGSLSFGRGGGELYLHLSRIPFEGLPAVRLMRDLDVIHDSDESSVLLKISGSLLAIVKETVSSSVGRKRAIKGMTPQQLAVLQQTQSQQGALAEEYVLEFERRRLDGHMFLNLVVRISTHSVSAGYDIESFDGLESFVPDRFVEVKSFCGEEHFYLSEGELEMARALGNGYYIYLVDMSKYSLSDYVPLIIRNPASELFRSGSTWSLVPISYRVDRVTGKATYKE